MSVWLVTNIDTVAACKYELEEKREKAEKKIYGENMLFIFLKTISLKQQQVGKKRFLSSK